MPMAQSNPDNQFPVTSWTMIQAMKGDTVESHRAFNRFATNYHAPLLAYAKRRGLSHEDARDVLQSYFEYLVRKDTLRGIDQKKWTLRRFLRVTFKRFIISWIRKQKPRHTTFHESAHVTPTDGPDKQFEKDWAHALLERTFNKLRQRYRSPGEEELYDILEAGLPKDKHDRLPHAKVAERFGLTVDVVKARLSRLRKHFRELLESEIQETVPDPADVADEIKYLFRLFRS